MKYVVGVTRDTKKIKVIRPINEGDEPILVKIELERKYPLYDFEIEDVLT